MSNRFLNFLLGPTRSLYTFSLLVGLSQAVGVIAIILLAILLRSISRWFRLDGKFVRRFSSDFRLFLVQSDPAREFTLSSAVHDVGNDFFSTATVKIRRKTKRNSNIVFSAILAYRVFRDVPKTSSENSSRFTSSLVIDLFIRWSQSCFRQSQ